MFDLEALNLRLPSRPLTRFAPSPTGYLHLGHVVNAIYVWGLAGALDGRVLLRIEDHDRLRSKPEFERALMDDLAWLGFAADAGTVRQSDELQAYASALAELSRSHHVYGCDCSRKEIAAAVREAEGQGDHSEELRYLGRCRGGGLSLTGDVGIRVAIDPGDESFDDARLGRQVQEPAMQCGDLLLRDRDGFWTYQFAVTVDDLRQHVDLVIRGEDLLPSTGRQILLGRMLGRRTAPVFLHHGLLLKSTGEKLSKSNRDTGVRDLRASGVTAPEAIGRAAALCGLIAEPRALAVSDLPALFTR